MKTNNILPLFCLVASLGLFREAISCEYYTGSDTAWAYDEDIGLCFDTLDLSRWGWYMELTEGSHSFPIYAGAGQCDLDAGTYVGELEVEYSSDGSIDVTYNVLSGVVLSETHFWAGETPLPEQGNGYTAAPGKFNHIEAPITNNIASYSLTDEGYSPLYIAAHASVSGSGWIGDDCSEDTAAPTVAPTPIDIEEESGPTGAYGDPHITLWSGEHFDFHGACDLVLLKNPSFENGLGMDIHLRTKFTKMWSFIDTAVIKIGKETFQVKGSDDGDAIYWINGVLGADMSQDISGYSIEFSEPSSIQREFIINLEGDEKISIRTFKSLIRVDIVSPTHENFGESQGLMGSFPTGMRYGRDGVTLLNDDNDFGQAWQVLADEPMLFHKAEGAQAPELCPLPTASSRVRRRRLAESSISEEEARAACARVSPDFFDNCVFDVLAINDKAVAGAY